MKNSSTQFAVSVLLSMLMPFDLTAQWGQVASLGSSICCLAGNDTILFAGTLLNGMACSNKTGMGWTGVNVGATGGSIFCIGVRGTFMFTGTFGGVFRSTDCGTSWSPAGLERIPVHSIVMVGSRLFAATPGGGVFISPDSGTTWTPSNSGLTDPRVATLALFGGILFAGTEYGGLFSSTNYGTTWDSVEMGITDPRVVSMTICGTDLFAGTWGNGLFRSTDNGASWTALSSGLTDSYFNSLAVSGTNLFAGTEGGGVFHSTNNGMSWTSANYGLTNNYIWTLAIFGTYLFAGLENGSIERRPLSDMIPSAGLSNIPVASEFVLDQNYPNPFNPATTIRYNLPHKSQVLLTVYNTLGQQVATLVQGQQEAGSYEVTFNGSALASGVYFYRLEAGSFVGTKRLLLLK
jgi:hypothetical protein